MPTHSGSPAHLVGTVAFIAVLGTVVLLHGGDLSLWIDLDLVGLMAVVVLLPWLVARFGLGSSRWLLFVVFAAVSMPAAMLSDGLGLSNTAAGTALSLGPVALALATFWVSMLRRSGRPGEAP